MSKHTFGEDNRPLCVILMILLMDSVLLFGDITAELPIDELPGAVGCWKKNHNHKFIAYFWYFILIIFTFPSEYNDVSELSEYEIRFSVESPLLCPTCSTTIGNVL